MNIYILQLIAGLIGMLAHAFVKVKKINDRILNDPKLIDPSIGMVFNRYFLEDYPILGLSFIFTLAQMIFYSEVLHLNVDSGSVLGISSKYFNWMKAFSCTTLIGTVYMAESIIMAFTGTAEKKLKSILGKKEQEEKEDK